MFPRGIWASSFFSCQNLWDRPALQWQWPSPTWSKALSETHLGAELTVLYHSTINLFADGFQQPSLYCPQAMRGAHHQAITLFSFLLSSLLILATRYTEPHHGEPQSLAQYYALCEDYCGV